MKEDFVCYITYAVPSSMLSALPFVPEFHQDSACGKADAATIYGESEIYPPGFMPEWFLGGSFPEDDYDD